MATELTDKQRSDLLECFKGEFNTQLTTALSVWKAEFMEWMAALGRFWKNKAAPALRKYINEIAAAAVAAGAAAKLMKEALKFILGAAAKAALPAVIDKAGAEEFIEAFAEVLVVLASFATGVVVGALVQTMVDAFTSCVLRLFPNDGILDL